MFRILTTAAILTFAVTTAQAETPQSMVVAYGDLNLSQSRDAEILADRLQAAATSVCANTVETNAPIRKVLIHRCIDQAVSRATSQIWDQIEAGPNRVIRANLVNVRQKVANADTLN